MFFFLGPNGARCGLCDVSRAFSKALSVFGDADGDFELVLGLGDTVLVSAQSSIITAGVLEALTGNTKKKRLTDRFVGCR
jgi:hypothetical protein